MEQTEVKHERNCTTRPSTTRNTQTRSTTKHAKGTANSRSPASRDDFVDFDEGVAETVVVVSVQVRILHHRHLQQQAQKRKANNVEPQQVRAQSAEYRLFAPQLHVLGVGDQRIDGVHPLVALLLRARLQIHRAILFRVPAWDSDPIVH